MVISQALNNFRHALLFSLFILASTSMAQIREIAITLDDLPLVAGRMDTPVYEQRTTEQFMNIMKALVDYQVPATGFVVAGAIAKGQMDFLEAFKEAGFMLGNHTYSHYNLNVTNTDKYIADIDRADQKLATILTTPKYFRYPYLAEGSKGKKEKVLNYLKAHGYTIAPVTIDSLDFRFNERLYHVSYRNREAYVYKLKPQYLAFIWKQTLKAENRANGEPVKQILLLHANVLNSYLLGDVLRMYKEHGYTFISLTEALKNPATAISFPPGRFQERKNKEPPTFYELLLREWAAYCQRNPLIEAIADSFMRDFEACV